ncbi:MAG TPA: transglutaminase domain-containing protein [Bacteroidales bacterium]
MARLLLFSLFWLISWQLNGQTEKESDKSSSLDAAIKEVMTDITFSLDKNAQTVKVTETSGLQLVSLKPDNNVAYGIGYNDNSAIIKAKSPDSRVDKICGNYRPDWVFHSDDMLCVFSLKFKETGETKTFLYEKEYSDIRYFTAYSFAERYPVMRNTVRFLIPDWLDIEFKEYNTEDYGLKTTKSYDPKEKVTTVEYHCEKIDGYETGEKNIPAHSFVYPHILIIPKSYQTKDSKIRIFGNLDDFYQWSHGLAGRASTSSAELKPMIEKLVEGKQNDADKIKSIYYWVQDNIRYIAFEDGLHGYVPDGADKVFTQKYGDCKGKANLLKTMLKLAGYDARLTWVGTNDICYNFSAPILSTFNHMVCTLLLNNKHYLLDATDNYLPFDQNPDYLQGRQALVEDGDRYILDTIPVAPITDNMVRSKHHYSVSGDMLKGDVEIDFTGERKDGLLKKISGTRTDERPKLFENIITREEPKISATGITTSDLQDRENPLVVKGNTTVKGNILQFDNDLYITPDPFDDLSGLTTKPDRKNPLDLSIRICRKTETIIDLPEGYKILKVPDNQSFSNDLIRFTMTYAMEGNTIRYSKEITTFERIIPKRRLQDWNTALKQLKRSSSQPFVLRKTKL